MDDKYKYKLFYFDFVGRGEPIRLLLEYKNIPFEDIRIPNATWPSIRPNMPLGQLPVLEINGVQYCQTTPICRYLSKIVGLNGKSDLENLEIDIVGETINDLLTIAYQLQFIHYPGEKEAAEDKLKTKLPMTLKKLEEGTKKHEGFLASKNLSWADIFFLTAYEDLRNMLDKDVLSGYPGLESLKKTLLSQGFIRNWIEKRPRSPDGCSFDIKSEL